jgi:hypothetical protein
MNFFGVVGCSKPILERWGQDEIRFHPTELSAVVFAERHCLAQPKENISKGLHPNLAAAQRLSQAAWEKIVAAQQANEWDLQGHAQKPRNCWIRSTTNQSSPPKPRIATRTRSS